MKTIVVIIVVGIDLAFGVGIHRSAGTFCYDDPLCDEDSDKWGGICRTGTKQSPIDLHPSRQLVGNSLDNRRESELLGGYRDLDFNTEYAANSFVLFNNGHTIKVELKSRSSAQMSGYQMDNGYRFSQAHFHWGDQNSAGSEHTIRHQRFPIEVHFVHFSSKYSDLGAAENANDPKAIAVVAVFLQESSCGGRLSCSEGHQALRPIIQHLPLKYNPQGVTVNRELDLTELLPRSSDAVYRYLGSLTTPNCTEKVIWTVAEEPVLVSSADIKAFHHVKNRLGHPLLNNYRKTKDKNFRKVEYFYVN